jgi:hypothetical protein
MGLLPKIGRTPLPVKIIKRAKIADLHENILFCPAAQLPGPQTPTAALSHMVTNLDSIEKYKFR